MDALSEALLAVRATGAIFFRVDCAAPWGFAVPNAKEAAHLLFPGAERIVNYHLVTEGRAIVHIGGAGELDVEAGDLVILPHGDAHTVGNGHPNEYVDSAQALTRLASDRPTTIRLGGEGELARIICGFIGCGRLADRLLLSGLPHVLRVGLRAGAADEWLTRTVEHLTSEAEAGLPGASIILSRMAETIFVEALRRFVRDLPPEQTGWLAAARDPIVGAALALLHRNPGHLWTTGELARRVGASPSALAKRFRLLLEETPVSYLRHWRLHLAAEMLGESRETIFHVAADVGYQSEAAFNRAFRAEFGIPPARYRRQANAGR